MHRVLTLLLAFGSIDAAAQSSTTKVPNAAVRLVAAVHDAATSGQPEAIRKFMSPDFVSSFGGDGGPDQAIAMWSQDRSCLRHLAQSTAGRCQLKSADYVECPPHAGIEHRAGFKLHDNEWVFFALVAGD